MRAFIATILLIVLHTAYGQDSLIRFSDIKFSSAFEENNFHKYFTDKSHNYIDLLLSTNNQINASQSELIQARINKLVDEIKVSNYQDKKPQKQIKGVYEKIHNTFLTKYEIENRFYEIFESGNYNCVTATALYAIIFEKLNIPYAIKEEPTHVYLVAYPDIHNILVETTTPAFGFLNFDQAFKNNFINNLKNQKIISKNEVDANTTEQLFNKYYFSTENINLEKLVGIHYMNDAIFLQEHENTKASFEQAEKAYLFYPSKRCQYLVASFGSLYAGNTELDPLTRSKLIAKLSRHKHMGITNDMIKGEFNNVTQEVMVKKNDKQLYNDCYHIFIDGIDDPELISDISYYYNYENARIYFNQGDFENARNYFRKSLVLQPNNVDLGLIFTQCLSRTFMSANPSSILDTVQMYREQFPALMKIQNFKSMVGTAYLLEFQNFYTKGKSVEGDKYKLLFEDLMDSNERLSINYDVVGQAYSIASTFYFKKGQKTKAKELIVKGLEYAPGSYELRVRQQMLER